MSEEQLKAFLKKVKGDTSLQEKFKAAAIHLMLLLIVDKIHAAKALQLTAEDNIKMQSATVELSELVEGHNGTVLHHGSDPSQIKIRPSTSTYPSTFLETTPPSYRQKPIGTIEEPRPAKMSGDEMPPFWIEEAQTTPAEW